MAYVHPSIAACANCGEAFEVGPIGRVPRFCRPVCRTATCDRAKRGDRPSAAEKQRRVIWGVLQGAGNPGQAVAAMARGCSMTRKAFTTLLALIALTMPAMVGQHTIYANDGDVVASYTTDGQGTTTLHGCDSRVISRATGNTVIMHDGMSGQVFDDRSMWGKRR
jgi:hypothetical protein